MNTTKTGFTFFLTNTSNTEAEQARFYARCLTCSMKGVKLYALHKNRHCKLNIIELINNLYKQDETLKNDKLHPCIYTSICTYCFGSS